MRRKKLARHQDASVEEPTINLTPLIDVVFVILIMFIVVAPLLELDRVSLANAPNNPAEGSTNIQETSPVSIHVHEDNTVWMNHQQVSIEQLTALLKQARVNHPKARPQLFHDRRAQFGTYQSIKNAAEIAGFAEMDIILKPA